MAEPAYLELRPGGELSRRVEMLNRRLRKCDLCPRECGVDRLSGEMGHCGVGEYALVPSFGPHHGEEDPLRGRKGSGTIFFGGCNLNCLYCQNADISQRVIGRPVRPDRLAEMMLELQGMGCHNINLVSPSHVVSQAVQAVALAADRGLRIPIVYNTGGYDSLKTLRALDGVIDIYMPDMKYHDPDVGLELSGVKDYPAVNRAAVLEMHRQVGDLALDRNGVAERGLLVRHLVLPGNLAGSPGILRFLAEQISTNTYLNIMDQYRPSHRAASCKALNRRINLDEYDAVVRAAGEFGLKRLDKPGLLI